MSLRVMAGRLDLLPTSIVCQLQDGATIVVCTIERQVLRDLGNHHFPGVSDIAALSRFLPEIERIASVKFYANRFDENGELTIRTADLLRYGFAQPGDTTGEMTRLAAE